MKILPPHNRDRVPVLGCVGLLVAILTCIVSIVIPEIRDIAGLSENHNVVPTTVIKSDAYVQRRDAAVTITSNASTVDVCIPKWFFTPRPEGEGCPQNLRYIKAAMQVFEFGQIIWLDDDQLDGQIFVLYNDSSWENLKGTIESIENVPTGSERLGTPSGRRSNYFACAAHSNNSGVISAYVNDDNGNILSWQLTVPEYGNRTWRLLLNTFYLGCS